MKLMQDVMDSEHTDIRLRFKAAEILMPFKYPKLSDGGKKVQQVGAAHDAAKGRFSTREKPAPKLPPPPLPRPH